MNSRLSGVANGEARTVIAKASEKFGYRPDIDGLRALAIIPVVLFHSGFALFSGGFIGVDIFFVISGYLITNLLVRDFVRQDFSIRAFYVRRVRRIFPALAATLVFSLALGFFVLLPNEFAAMGAAAKSMAYFASNYVFWNVKNDYWSQNLLSTQPLLHTWSLAVEEQFYIFLPCLLAIYFYFRSKLVAGASDDAQENVLGRAAAGLKIMLLVLIAVSFFLSMWFMRNDAAAAFYLLPSRAWELLLGSLLAVYLTGRGAAPARNWHVEIAGLAGLALILFAVFRYDNTTPFPGINALAPCIGASLLIYAGSGAKLSMTNRLLSLRPLTMVGLVSYSLYLWHWPILVFVKSAGWHAWGLPSISLPFVLVLTVFISWISWRWIEQPFRHRRSSFMSGGHELKIALAMLCCCYGLGMLAQEIGENAVPLRQPQPQMLVQLGHDVSATPGGWCEGNRDPAIIANGGGGCHLGLPSDTAHPLSFAIVGDSHARMWTTALDKVAADAGVSGVGLTYSSCTPALDMVPPSRLGCVKIMRAVLEYLAASPIKNVILAGYWVDAAESQQARAGEASVNFYNDLEKTLSLMSGAGKTVYLVLDVPELKNDEVPREKAVDSMRDGGKLVYGRLLREHRMRQAPMEQQVARLQKKYGFKIIDPATQICRKKGCLVARSGHTLYRDKHHLTDEGALFFREVFREPMLEIAASGK